MQEGSNNKLVGVRGVNAAKVNLKGTNISLSGDKSTAISLDKSTANLINGDITVGTNGTGVYAKNSNINLNNYTGKIKLGDKGIGIYSEDSTLTNGKLNVDYSGSNNFGVGVYYKGSAPVTNKVEVNHTGNKLVNIYANGVDLTNTANQTLANNDIGIYADSNAKVDNKATLNLNGNNSLGIYANGADITGIGTIKGTAVGNGANDYKIGVYTSNGDIKGNGVYNFDVDGGVGIYLKDRGMSYTGNMNLQADSTNNHRAIGVYVSPGINTTLSNGLTMTGKDSIGMYLAKPTTGSGANVVYKGSLDIKSNSSANKGIGVLAESGTTFTLGAGSNVKIGGTNNIGFYIKQGANLNMSGGTISNTADGTLAYLEGGQLHFTPSSTLNINYTNVTVSGNSGKIQNDTAITVGSKGLQGSDGATILNSNTGIINGTVTNGKAMVGTGAGTTLTNNGKINLSGDKSVGIYAEKGAVANSTGKVSVGKKSVAYYAGQGGTLNISGIASLGQDSTLISAAGGKINYTGQDISLPSNTIGVNISEPSVVNFNNKNINVASGATGIYVSKNGDFSGIQNIGKLNVLNNGIGIYLDNNKAFNSGLTVNLEKEALGIFTTKNSNISYTGVMKSSKENAKGILSTGTGTVSNSGNISLLGDKSIGVYSENGNLQNTGNIEVGNGAIVSGSLTSAVAMYGKNGNNIANSGNVKIGKNAVAIYGENMNISNSGTLSGTKGNDTAIYGIKSNIINSGNINMKDTSNGIYAKDGKIVNTANISVGNNKSAGIYGAGTTSVEHKNGLIKVGTKSTGIATEKGNIKVDSTAKINAGTESTYLYSADGIINNNSDMALSDYSVGIYTKNGKAFNTGEIKVGQSLVAAGVTKISVGMATEKGVVENSNGGKIKVDYENGVGMVANKGGKAINRGDIYVKGTSSYGMQATAGSIIENYGNVYVDGARARGIAASKSAKIINETSGVIDVKGAGNEGVYVESGASVENKGKINVDGASNTGIFVGQGGKIVNNGTINVANGAQATIKGGGEIKNIGDITIDGPKATIDGVQITNIGTINVNGVLDFDKIALGSTEGHIGTINAKSFNKGEFLILPNATQGSNHLMYTVQYLKGAANVPNRGTINAISHSVSFLADLQKDKNDPNKVEVVMVKVPYEKLLNNTEAVEFGKGLDQIYEGAKSKELEMFDALDMISDKDELGETFDNELRGNVYANIQNRMLDVQDVFDLSYDTLKSNPLYARKQLKIGAILRGGEYKDKNPAVINYDSTTKGVYVLREYDLRKFGRMSNWDIGFAQTDFDFDRGSEERVYSLTAGAGFEDYIKDSKNWKLYTRGEVTLNHHKTEREINLSSGSYENTGKYWSALALWKNKLRYEVPSSTEKLTGGLFGTFNLGYGAFEDVKEGGDGIRLDVKSRDMYTVRPGFGGDISLNRYTEHGKFSLVGKATAEYELGEIYDGPNKAKIKNTKAGYYKLEEPKKTEEVFKFTAELKYKSRDEHSIGFDVTREEGSVKSTTYGVNFQYKF